MKLTSPSSSSVSLTISSLFDKRGRYSVPAKIVKNANLRPYTIVTFENVNGEIKIRRAKSRDDKSATVDKYSNIRIPKKEFELAFKSVPSKNDLKIDSTSIGSDCTITLSI